MEKRIRGFNGYESINAEKEGRRIARTRSSRLSLLLLLARVAADEPGRFIETLDRCTILLDPSLLRIALSRDPHRRSFISSCPLVTIRPTVYRRGSSRRQGNGIPPSLSPPPLVEVRKRKRRDSKLTPNLSTIVVHLFLVIRRATRSRNISWKGKEVKVNNTLKNILHAYFRNSLIEL